MPFLVPFILSLQRQPLARIAFISFSSYVYAWLCSCGFIKHYVVSVYVELNLHKLYLNKQHFWFGNLHILIIQLQFLYLNCSWTCHHIPYSLFPFPIDGHLAFFFFNYLFIFVFAVAMQTMLHWNPCTYLLKHTFSCWRDNVETLHSSPKYNY